MFRTLDYLQKGNDIQRKAYVAIGKLRIMDTLSTYNPILCGTIPISIDVEGSDLDIILEVNRIREFEKIILESYSALEGFSLQRKMIREAKVTKVNFVFEGFEFELFGQSQPSHLQNAYLHMVIENRILEEFPEIRKKVISLKKKGMKTEPAFCQILGLTGDPYDTLLEYGRRRGFI